LGTAQEIALETPNLFAAALGQSGGTAADKINRAPDTRIFQSLKCRLFYIQVQVRMHFTPGYESRRRATGRPYEPKASGNDLYPRSVLEVRLAASRFGNLSIRNTTFRHRFA
jgi:hypothetical protein